MPEKKSWRPFIIYLLIVIIGSALAGYAGVKLSEAGTFRTEEERQADAKETQSGTDKTETAAGGESAPAVKESAESGILEPPGLLEGEEEAPEPDTENTASPFRDPDPSLVYPAAYNMTVSGFDGLPFSKDALIRALGDFGYENNLTITRADYAGGLEGNGKNAVSFGCGGSSGSRGRRGAAGRSSRDEAGDIFFSSRNNGYLFQHRNGGTVFHEQMAQHAGRGRLDGIGKLIGLHVEEGLALLDLIAYFFQPFADSTLGHGKAEFRHNYYFSHDGNSPFRQASGRDFPAET